MKYQIKQRIKKTYIYKILFFLHVKRLQTLQLFKEYIEKIVLYIKNRTPHIILQYLSSDYKEYESFRNHLQSKKNTQNVSPITDLITVIIPTKNAGPIFEQVVQRILNQSNVTNIQLIVVDSGSTDQTRDIASKYHAQVISENPSSFSHSQSRNKAAQYANGTYIVFTVQDALLLNDKTLYESISFLKESNAKAISARHIPYFTSDAFAAWNVYSYMNMISPHEQDRIIQCNKQRFDGLSFTKKRSMCILDDTFAVYKKKTFDKMNQYESTLSFAEDLDMAKRMICKGHEIGFLYSNGIIHSHTRPPEYILKRFFTNTYYTYKILESRHFINSSLEAYSIEDILRVCYYIGNNTPSWYKQTRCNHTKQKNTSAFLQNLISQLGHTKKTKKLLELEAIIGEVISFHHNEALDFFSQYFNFDNQNSELDFDMFFYWNKVNAMAIGILLAQVVLYNEYKGNSDGQKIYTALTNNI